MSKKKTEINPKRAENIKKLIELEHITQGTFAKKTHQTPQNVSRIVQMKQPLTEENAKIIHQAFPEYSLEWLLGYTDCMTYSEMLDDFYKKAQKIEDDNYYIVRYLMRKKDIDFVLYDSGIYQNEYGAYEDRYLIRKDDKESLMTFSEVYDLIDDLSALVENRLNRSLSKSSTTSDGR